jgi:hypothetical protein
MVFHKDQIQVKAVSLQDRISRTPAGRRGGRVEHPPPDAIRRLPTLGKIADDFSKHGKTRGRTSSLPRRGGAVSCRMRNGGGCGALLAAWLAAGAAGGEPRALGASRRRASTLS